MKSLPTLIVTLLWLVVAAQPVAAQDQAQSQTPAAPQSDRDTATVEPAAREERTVVIVLKHASVESTLAIVKQLLPPNARIVGDPERQQLFVSGSQADIEKVNEIVGQID